MGTGRMRIEQQRVAIRGVCSKKACILGGETSRKSREAAIFSWLASFVLAPRAETERMAKHKKSRGEPRDDASNMLTGKAYSREAVEIRRLGHNY